MTGVAGRESHLSAILGRSFASLRAEAPVVAVVAVITAGLTFGVQMAPRLFGSTGHQGWPVLLTTGLALLLQAPLSGLVIQRVLRREAGETGSVQDDLRRTLAVAGELFAVALLLAAPSMIQLVLLQTMAGAQDVSGRGLASILSLATSIATIVLYLNWPLTSTALLDRRRGILDALGAGRAALKGHRWLLIGVFALVFVVFFIPQSFVLFSSMAARMRAAQAGDVIGYATWQLAYLSVLGGLQVVVTSVVQTQFYLRLRASAAGLPGGETAALFD